MFHFRFATRQSHNLQTDIQSEMKNIVRNHNQIDVMPLMLNIMILQLNQIRPESYEGFEQHVRHVV